MKLNDNAYLPIMTVQLLLVSGTYLFAKIGTNEIPVIPFALLRFLISGLLLFLFCISTGRARPVARRDWGMLLLLSVLLIPINQGFFLFGQKVANTTHGALIYALTPIFIAVLARSFIREKIPALRWLGIALGVAGAVLVIAGSGLRLGSDSLRGDILIFFAMLSWAFFTIFGKDFVMKYGAFYSMTLIQLAGLAIVLPAAPLGFSQLADAIAAGAITPAGWLALLYVSIGTSVLSYALWYWALARVPSAKLGVWMSLQPVVATAYSIMAYGLREITPYFLFGGAIAVAGVIIAQIAGSGAQKQPQPAAPA